MALSESASAAYYGAPSQSPHQPSTQSQQHEETTAKDQQNSNILSLTLDEIQLKSGKPFGSMNMDEFITNLWNSVDDNLVPSQPDDHIEPNDKIIIETQQPSTLTRQNSFSIPIQLCKKTVEEVWSEIQKDEPLHKLDNMSNREPPLRQQTFGEITLEEFLIKAGVVQGTSKSSQQKIAPPPPIQNNNTGLDANFGMGLGFSTHPNVANNYLVNGYAAYPIYAPTRRSVGAEMLPNNGDQSNEKSLCMGEAGGLNNNKKRIIDGPPEVVVERRQRRMIKNRESAARSRARKQAYTVELEVELNQLREENEKLKQIVKEYEEKGAQEVIIEEKGAEEDDESKNDTEEG
ncbi:hypothetical protein Dsin_019761 [Dipteronia sinensis]|uniref:BZIP domain-containing protein n=1 Tax=Dipteronia sinensis TaxID=43782 RepID=A0AAE0A862_9ROSI|nr:hypothetical protein Dsin_019761 [Dipteronia sinensis]